MKKITVETMVAINKNLVVESCARPILNAEGTVAQKKIAIQTYRYAFCCLFISLFSMVVDGWTVNQKDICRNLFFAD